MASNGRSNTKTLAGVMLLAIAVASIVTAGCMTGTTTPGAIVGIPWSLDSYLAENNTLIPALPGSDVSARFGPDGRVAGSAGCNQYGGSYHLDDTDLTISPPVSTKMYCNDPAGLMEQEARFLELLGSAAGYQVGDDRLEITDTSGATVLTFVKATPAELAGTSWTLVSLAGEGGAWVPVIAGTTVSITFDTDGTLGGTAGCNRYGAEYTRDGAEITLGTAFMTEMYCMEPGVMDQEDRYIVHLMNVALYRVEGGRLILSDESGADLLIFDRAVEVPDIPLVGTDWVLDGYSTGGDAVSSVIAGTTITMKFSPDGNVTGNAGCNRYFAAYEVSGEVMTIGPAGSTKIYCGEPEGIMEQEARYLTLLESVAGYRIDGDRLDLLDEAGETLLSYRAESGDLP